MCCYFALNKRGVLEMTSYDKAPRKPKCFSNKDMNFIGIAKDYIVMYGKEQNEEVHSHYSYQLLIPTHWLAINGKVIHTPVLIDSYYDHYVYADGKVVSLLIQPDSDFGRKIKVDYFQEKPIVYIHHKKLIQKVREFNRNVFCMESIQKLVNFIVNEVIVDAKRLNHQDTRVEKAVNYIKISDFQQLSYSDVIESAFLSKSRLAYLFKKEMGIPIMKYMTWQRLIQASEKLAISKKTITEVAHRYGFADAAHFSRLFKEHFGTNPRKIFQNKHHVHVFKMIPL